MRGLRWWLFLGVIIFIKEEVHELNFIDFIPILRGKDLFRSAWVDVQLLSSLLIFLFLFLELVLYDTEEIFEMVSFFKRSLALFDWQKIFIQVLMSKFHHIAFFGIHSLWLWFLLLAKTEILKDLIFALLGLRKPCCSVYIGCLWWFDLTYYLAWWLTAYALTLHRFWFTNLYFLLCFLCLLFFLDLFFYLELIELNNIPAIHLDFFQIFEEIRIFDYLLISQRNFQPTYTILII